jgi:hypothetical protein
LLWLQLKQFSSSGEGVSAKSSEVGRRGEVGGREKLWAREGADKIKKFG